MRALDDVVVVTNGVYLIKYFITTLSSIRVKFGILPGKATPRIYTLPRGPGMAKPHLCGQGQCRDESDNDALLSLFAS